MCWPDSIRVETSFIFNGIRVTCVLVRKLFKFDTIELIINLKVGRPTCHSGGCCCCTRRGVSVGRQTRETILRLAPNGNKRQTTSEAWQPQKAGEGS